MTVEQLHDALNQLPDDLIAETDALRQKDRKKPVLWKRVVPMAACFVLVLGVLFIAPFFHSGKSAAQDAAMEQEAYSDIGNMAGAPEFGSPAAPAEPESPMEQVPVPETAGRGTENDGAPLAPDSEEAEATSTEASIPVTTHVLKADYFGTEAPQITVASTESQWLEYLECQTGLAEVISHSYDAAYFEDRQLIIVVTEAASSSVEYRIDAIRKTAVSCWELTGVRYAPQWQTEDMVHRYILVELPRMVEPEDTVLLTLVEEGA